MTAAAKRHMDRVAELGCILCRHTGQGHSPAELHHIREGQGAGQRSADTLVIPLCPYHHRGPAGVHGLGTRGLATRYRVSELDLLAMTLEAMA